MIELLKIKIVSKWYLSDWKTYKKCLHFSSTDTSYILHLNLLAYELRIASPQDVNLKAFELQVYEPLSFVSLIAGHLRVVDLRVPSLWLGIQKIYEWWASLTICQLCAMNRQVCGLQAMYQSVCDLLVMSVCTPLKVRKWKKVQHSIMYIFQNIL